MHKNARIWIKKYKINPNPAQKRELRYHYIAINIFYC